MRKWIIGIIIVIVFATVTGWISKADAQVVTVTDSEGETTEVFCYSIGEFTFCE